MPFGHLTNLFSQPYGNEIVRESGVIGGGLALGGDGAETVSLTFKGIEQISFGRCIGSFDGDVGVPSLGVADFVGDADKVGKCNGAVKSRGGATGGGGRAGLQQILGNDSVTVKLDPDGKVRRKNDFFNVGDVGNVGDDRPGSAKDKTGDVGDVGGVADA